MRKSLGKGIHRWPYMKPQETRVRRGAWNRSFVLILLGLTYSNRCLNCRAYMGKWGHMAGDETLCSDQLERLWNGKEILWGDNHWRVWPPGWGLQKIQGSVSTLDKSHWRNIPDVHFYVYLYFRRAFWYYKAGEPCSVQHHLLAGLRLQVWLQWPRVYLSGGPNQQVSASWRLTFNTGNKCCLPNTKMLLMLGISGALGPFLVISSLDFQLVPLDSCIHNKQKAVGQVGFRQQGAQLSPVQPIKRNVEPAATQRLCGCLHASQAKSWGWNTPELIMGLQSKWSLIFPPD